MNRRQEFEAFLAKIANTPVAFAGNNSSNSTNGKHSMTRAKANLAEFDLEVTESEVLEEVRRAFRRQKNNPSLFSGDPEGFFTYDDPVLAIAAYLHQSHLLMSSALGIAGDPGERLKNESLWSWLKTAVHMWRSRNDKGYLTLMGMTPREPIRIDKKVLRIAVVGDAGFDCQAQKNVIDRIRRRHLSEPFDMLVHLGDIYFAGSSGEMLKNFLAPFRHAGPRVFSLVGNHDLYFGGEAFISVLEDLLQPGRYFSIENQYWRIACLDTAVPAESLRRNSGQLDKGQLAWLKSQLELQDGRETILMSHHFIVSGWHDYSKVLKQQLGQRLDKVFSWYWGHEHSCASYDQEIAGFNGACVGNGAFLEVWKPPVRDPKPQWYAQGRCSCYRKDSKFWPHGYLELELQPRKVIERFFLEGNESFVRSLPRIKRTHE
jgi:hypothetical protein